MAPQRLGIGRAAATFALIVVLVVGAFGLFSLTYQIAGGPMTYSTNSPSGLQVRIELNATTILEGFALKAQVVLFNPLDQNISVMPDYSSNSTIAEWNPYDGFFCGSNDVWSIAGAGVFQGHYTSDNFSSAGEPLTLVPPLSLLCINETNPTHVVFLPNSTLTTLSSLQSPTHRGPDVEPNTLGIATQVCVNAPYGNGVDCSPGASLFGYWNDTLSNAGVTIKSPNFHYFSPGEYTIAAEDQWGQNVFAYFKVIQ